MTTGREFPTRGEQLTAMHARLTAAVEQLIQDEAWQRMLRIAAALPHYSPSNVLLIATQCPEATYVMGYRAWVAHGRHVMEGEKGIAILAPCLFRDTRPDPPTAEAAASTETSSETAQKVLRGYKVVHVFDISQTDGKDLPVPPPPLDGVAPESLYHGLATLAAEQGFTLIRGDCRGANGYTDFTTRTIHVRDDVPPAQAIKTLAHELGHVRADHATRFLDPATRTLSCRGAVEVEAESIAYLVLAAAGIDASPYSVPYVAGWSGGDTAVLREAATRAITIAAEIDRELDFVIRPPALSI